MGAMDSSAMTALAVTTRPEPDAGAANTPPRYPLGARGQLVIGGAHWAVPVRVFTLSRAAAALHTDAAVAKGTKGQLAFGVLCDGKEVRVALQVVVRQCVLEGSRYRIGVDFVGAGAQGGGALAAILESRRRVSWGY
jgi:hypothetical protein